MELNVNLDTWKLIAPIRNNLEEVPGMPGVRDFGMEFGERVFTLPCSISKQKNYTELINVADDIADWLNPYKGLQRLVFDDMPDRYWDVRLMNEVDMERFVMSAGTFDLVFVAPDPFGKAIEDDIFDITGVGKKEFTKTKGNIESEPILRIHGTLLQGQNITFNFNGTDVVRVNGPLTASEEFVIDVPKMTAKVINKSSKVVLRNGLNQLENLVFPKMHTGLNDVTISVSGGKFTKLNIKSESRWL